MDNDQKSQFETREAIMNMLSDDEVARVSTAETAKSLADGDEYVDLEQLDQGVRKAAATGTKTAMGRVLARKSVDDSTWRKIVAKLRPLRANHAS